MYINENTYIYTKYTSKSINGKLLKIETLTDQSRLKME